MQDVVETSHSSGDASTPCAVSNGSLPHPKFLTDVWSCQIFLQSVTEMANSVVGKCAICVSKLGCISALGGYIGVQLGRTSQTCICLSRNTHPCDWSCKPRQPHTEQYGTPIWWKDIFAFPISPSEKSMVADFAMFYSKFSNSFPQNGCVIPPSEENKWRRWQEPPPDARASPILIEKCGPVGLLIHACITETMLFSQ